MLKMAMMGFMKCEQATRLLSDRQERPLPPGRRFRLWIHLMSCKICKGYDKYLEKLRAACSRLRDSESALESGEKLSADARYRIRQKLQKPD